MAPVFTVPTIGGPDGPTGPVGPASPAQSYGGIAIRGFFTSGNPSQALATGSFQKVVNFSANMPSSGVTPQFALSQLTIDTSGDYLVFAGISYVYGPLGNMRMALFVNGAVRIEVIAGAKTFSFLPSHCDSQNVMSLVAGDVLDMRVLPSAAATLLVDNAQLYVERANP